MGVILGKNIIVFEKPVMVNLECEPNEPNPMPIWVAEW